ncbi:hypothetical protein Fcan01_18163 [Folsomia candida]|uniref:Uncharacterized protein n=1 Tax=Folsomia candida TaxID=158441 RepID=A0A226DQE9_FOLCA|nr:hypothetical protein Fcan01_18163 [Folsomia candida]
MKDTSKKSYRFGIYNVRFYPVQFVFVVPLPTVLGGIEAFMAPFSTTVWTTLFLCCVTITLICACARVEKNAWKVSENMVQDFLNVTSILFGQVSGTTLKMFGNKKWLAKIMLTIWFLGGGYTIIDNLYTGSIFSFMTAIQAPKVPPTFQMLVKDSEIRIITMASFHFDESANLSPFSTLRSLLIPAYLELFNKQPNYIDMLNHLSKKIMFVPIFFSYKLWQSFIRNVTQFKSIQYEHEILDTKSIFAVMDDSEDLKYCYGALKWSDSRLIIKAKEDTPFVDIRLAVGNANYLLPIFVKPMGLLLSSGLAKRWNELYDLYSILKDMRGHNSSNYKKYFSKVMYNVRDPVTFHESDPVSFESMKDIFVLCGTILLLAALIICYECTHFIGSYFTKDWNTLYSRIRLSFTLRLAIVRRMWTAVICSFVQVRTNLNNIICNASSLYLRWIDQFLIYLHARL